MLFIIWLSLRNLSHLLPLRVQHAIQDFSDRLGLARHIRLLEHNDSSDRQGGNTDVPFGIDLDEGSSDDDDDELPLASRFNGQPPSFGSSGRRQKLDRIVRLFSGGIQRAKGYGNLANSDEEEERVLDLPNLPSTNQHYRREGPTNTSSATTTLFRADSQEGDASPLPAQFSLSPARPQLNSSFVPGPLSPSTDRIYSPRSPIRSPSISRTPSLDAIVEETSVSPRTSIELTRQAHTQSPVEMESAVMSRFGSGSSHSQELPDWASARSSITNHVRDR